MMDVKISKQKFEEKQDSYSLKVSPSQYLLL